MSYGRLTKLLIGMLPIFIVLKFVYYFTDQLNEINLGWNVNFHIGDAIFHIFFDLLFSIFYAIIGSIIFSLIYQLSNYYMTFDGNVRNVLYRLRNQRRMLCLLVEGADLDDIKNQNNGNDTLNFLKQKLLEIERILAETNQIDFKCIVGLENIETYFDTYNLGFETPNILTSYSNLDKILINFDDIRYNQKYSLAVLKENLLFIRKFEQNLNDFKNDNTDNDEFDEQRHCELVEKLKTHKNDNKKYTELLKKTIVLTIENEKLFITEAIKNSQSPIKYILENF